MSFTNNTRDEVTLIFLKHKYRMNSEFMRRSAYLHTDLEVENLAIQATFKEVRERNAKNLQAGSYEAIGQICDEFFKSIAAEPALVG